MLSDYFGGEAEIRYALLTLSFCLVWSSLHFFLGARSYREDLLAKDA